MEALVLRAGGAVVRSVLKAWMTDHRNERDRAASLNDLVNVRLTDDFQRRRFGREIEALVDIVAQRLMPLCRQELAELEDGDKHAAITEVMLAFEGADLSDAGLFGVDVDATKLGRRLREALPDAPRRAGLSEAATRFYDVLLDECCVCYVQVVLQLAPFPARANAELLRRASGLSEQVDQVLERLPARTLMAPAGTAHDEEFRQRYAHLISESLDDVELFGVDTRQYRPRTTLSVAYISLSVRTQSRHKQEHLHDLPGDERRWSAIAESDEARTTRVETALAGDKRMLIRGDAGSGKSTLLKWLAVNAARGRFTGELAELNGYVPFLIKLRSYAGRDLPAPERFLDHTAPTLAGLMPDGFVHRQLDAGRALVLVDGVDELPAGHRNQVRNWLGTLVRAFPDIRLVVTSRPGAANAAWLHSEGFPSAFLDRLSSMDVRALVRHWHLAVQDAGGLPCDMRQLPHYEGALLSRLDGNPHLRALASSPLLCAMLCALNLDRQTFLPRDRLELYRAALTLLLDRRDAERRIPSAASLELSGRDKRHLLRHLAWRLSVNGRTELSRADAVRRLTEKMTTMPVLRCEPEEVLDHFVHRSGVVREPAVGRIDFVHRTFQEYLTAEEAADQGDVGLLIGHAHLDQWRDVVIMTAGLANAPLRNDLFEGLLDRSDSEPRNRRTLRLLAASAMEATPTLAPTLTDRMDRYLSDLVPPRRRSEARSLAAVGEGLLPRLTLDPNELSETSAAAVVRTAALINGSASLPILERFASDPRPAVQQQLVTAWEYFDPSEYADRVLAEAPLLDGQITVRNQTLLPYVTKLRRLTSLEANIENVSSLDLIANLPHLTEAELSGTFSDLSPLTHHQELTNVLLGTTEIDDPQPLVEMTHLRSLLLYPRKLHDIGFLKSMTGLTRLGLTGLDEIPSLATLQHLPNLDTLAIYDWPTGMNLAAILAHLTNLTSLDIGISQPPPRPGVVHDIAEAIPNLTELGLLHLDLSGETSELTGLQQLRRLSLRYCMLDDLGRLADMRSLDHLQIAGPNIQRYLPQIAQLKQLKRLDILTDEHSERDIDISTLGDRKLEVRAYRGRHQFTGVGKGIRIGWIGA